MSMSRKHFEALASALVHARSDSLGTNSVYALRRAARHIADVCATENSNFDRDRFMAAAGFPEPKDDIEAEEQMEGEYFEQR